MIEIRCLVLDVDGVLTDGRLFRADDETVTRAFHIRDGLAIQWFQRLVGPVIICTGKESHSITARAQELGITHVIQGSSHKLADLSTLLNELKIPISQVAAIGDDLPDLAVLRRCGLPITVADCAPELREIAKLVTQQTGGNGAVREAIEHILRETGRWAEVIAFYESQTT